VHEEADPGGGVEVEDGLQLLAHAHLGGLISGRPRPQAHLVLLGPHVDDRPADLVAIGELLANAGQELEKMTLKKKKGKKKKKRGE
jgi:hypothetical protein